MLAPFSLFPSPSSQPMLGRALSEGFIENNGAPSGLWMPLGDERAYDLSGNNSPAGALNGGITTTPGGFGTLGSAWKFNGTTGYIDLGTSFNPTGPFSVVAFFIPPVGLTQTDNLMIVARDDGTANCQFNLSIGGSAGAGHHYSARFASDIGGSFRDVISANDVYIPGGVNLGVGVYDGAAMRVYANGVQVATAAASGAVNSLATEHVMIGARKISSPSLFFLGNVMLVMPFSFALSSAQVSSLYQALRTGEPYPLFQPQTVPMMLGSAAGPASASGAGGLIASGSLIASSILSVVGGIVSTFNLVASSLYDAAAGIQAAAAEAVISNITSGSAGISAASVEQVLSNLASASAGMNAVAAHQVLTNLITASGGIAGSQSLIASSIISVLAKIQAIAEESTAIAAQGLAGLSATGDVQVLNNLIALNEQLSAAASFVASNIYSAAARVDGPGSVAVLINLLSVAERVQALAQQLASSVNAMQAGSGASATVIASSLYRASAGCGAFATVSAILDAAICELASIRPSYTAEAILRAMFKSAAGVRPSYAARADIDGC